MEGESEIFKCAKVWVVVLICLCYCFVIGNITQKGITRLFYLLPVVSLFLLLPLSINSVHLVGNTSFFVSWLANFKLLLFAFGLGPLCTHPSLSLSQFLALACMPIKIHHQFPNPNPNGESISTKGRNRNSIFKYATMGLLLGLLIRIYDYSDRLNPKFVLFLYSVHLYFSLEIVLAMAAALTRTILGVELEPQFDEPYLSTSLQDFWGRRWNLMVTGILRPTVFEPVRRLSSRAVGRKWAPLPAVMATFAASAMMHELVFYYMGRMRPNWEMSGFFLLHGSCLVAEIAVKKVVAGRFRLPGVVSGALTVGFVIGSGLWLFFPQFIRVKADVRALEEYAAVGAFVRDMGVSFLDFIQLNPTATI